MMNQTKIFLFTLTLLTALVKPDTCSQNVKHGGDVCVCGTGSIDSDQACLSLSEDEYQATVVDFSFALPCDPAVFALAENALNKCNGQISNLLKVRLSGGLYCAIDNDELIYRNNDINDTYLDEAEVVDHSTMIPCCVLEFQEKYGPVQPGVGCIGDQANTFSHFQEVNDAFCDDRTLTYRACGEDGCDNTINPDCPSPCETNIADNVPNNHSFCGDNGVRYNGSSRYCQAYEAGLVTGYTTCSGSIGCQECEVSNNPCIADVMENVYDFYRFCGNDGTTYVDPSFYCRDLEAGTVSSYTACQNTGGCFSCEITDPCILEINNNVLSGYSFCGDNGIQYTSPNLYCQNLEAGTVSSYTTCQDVGGCSSCEVPDTCVADKLLPRNYTANTICNHKGQFFNNLATYCGTLDPEDEPDITLCNGRACENATDCCMAVCKTTNRTENFFCDSNFNFHSDVDSYCTDYCESGGSLQIERCDGAACDQPSCSMKSCISSHSFAGCHPSTFRVLSPREICEEKFNNNQFTPLTCQSAFVDVDCNRESCFIHRCEDNVNNRDTEGGICDANGTYHSDPLDFCAIAFNPSGPALKELNCLPTNYYGVCGSEDSCCVSHCVQVTHRETPFQRGCDSTTFKFFNNVTDYCVHFCSTGETVEFLEGNNGRATKEECCVNGCSAESKPSVCVKSADTGLYGLIEGRDNCVNSCTNPDTDVHKCEGECGQWQCLELNCINEINEIKSKEVCSLSQDNSSVQFFDSVTTFCRYKANEAEPDNYLPCRKKICLNEEDCRYSKCFAEHTDLTYPMCDSSTNQIFRNRASLCTAISKDQTVFEDVTENVSTCCNNNCLEENEHSLLDVSNDFNVISKEDYCSNKCDNPEQKFDVLKCDEDCSDNDSYIHRCIEQTRSKLVTFPICVTHEGQNNAVQHTSIFDYCREEVMELGITTDFDQRVKEFKCDGSTCPNIQSCCMVYCQRENVFANKCTQDFEFFHRENECMDFCEVNPLTIDGDLIECEGEDGCSPADCKIQQCNNNTSFNRSTACLSYPTKFEFYTNREEFCSVSVDNALEEIRNGGDPLTVDYFDQNASENDILCDGTDCQTKRDCCISHCLISNSGTEGSCIVDEDFRFIQNEEFCANKCDSEDYDLFSYNFAPTCNNFDCTEIQCKKLKCLELATPLTTKSCYKFEFQFALFRNTDDFCQYSADNDLPIWDDEFPSLSFACIGCEDGRTCCMNYCTLIVDPLQPKYDLCNSVDYSIIPGATSCVQSCFGLPGIVDPLNCGEKNCTQIDCYRKRCENELTELIQLDSPDSQSCFRNNQGVSVKTVRDFCASKADSEISHSNFIDNVINVYAFSCNANIGQQCENGFDCCRTICQSEEITDSCHSNNFEFVTKSDQCKYRCGENGFRMDFEPGTLLTCEGDCTENDCKIKKCISQITDAYGENTVPTNFCIMEEVGERNSFANIEDYCTVVVGSGVTENFSIHKTVDTTGFTDYNDNCAVAICNADPNRRSGCTSTFILKTREEYCSDIDKLSPGEELHYEMVYFGDREATQQMCDVNKCVSDLERDDESICYRDGSRVKFLETTREYCIDRVQQITRGGGEMPDTFQFESPLSFCFENQEACLSSKDCCLAICKGEQRFFGNTCVKDEDYRYVKQNEGCEIFCSGTADTQNFSSCTTGSAIIDCEKALCRRLKCFEDNWGTVRGQRVCASSQNESPTFMSTARELQDYCRAIVHEDDPTSKDYSINSIECTDCSPDNCCISACKQKFSNRTGFCTIESYDFTDVDSYCVATCTNEKLITDFVNCDNGDCSFGDCKVKQCMNANSGDFNICKRESRFEGGVIFNNNVRNYCEDNFNNNDAIPDNYLPGEFSNIQCDGSNCKNVDECAYALCMNESPGAICKMNTFKFFPDRKAFCDSNRYHSEADIAILGEITEDDCNISACQQSISGQNPTAPICAYSSDGTYIYSRNKSAFCNEHKIKDPRNYFDNYLIGPPKNLCDVFFCNLFGSNKFCETEGGNNYRFGDDIVDYCSVDYRNNTSIPCTDCSSLGCIKTECKATVQENRPLCLAPSESNSYVSLRYFFEDSDDFCDYHVEQQSHDNPDTYTFDFQEMDVTLTNFNKDAKECCVNRCKFVHKYSGCDTTPTRGPRKLITPEEFCSQLCDSEDKDKIENIEFCTDEAFKNDKPLFDRFYDNAARDCTESECSFKTERAKFIEGYIEGQPGICGSNEHYYESLDRFVEDYMNNNINASSDDGQFIKSRQGCGNFMCNINDKHLPGYCEADTFQFYNRSEYCRKVHLREEGFIFYKREGRRATERDCNIKRCINNEENNHMVCDSNFRLVKTKEKCEDTIDQIGGSFFSCGDNDCNKRDCQVFKCVADLPDFIEERVCDNQGNFFTNKKEFCSNQMNFGTRAIPCPNGCMEPSDCAIAKCIHDNKEGFKAGCFPDEDGPHIYREVEEYCEHLIEEHNNSSPLETQLNNSCLILDCLDEHDSYTLFETRASVINEYTNSLDSAYRLCQSKVNGNVNIKMKICDEGCDEEDLRSYQCNKKTNFSVPRQGGFICGSNGQTFEQTEDFCDFQKDNEDVNFILCNSRACKDEDDCCHSACILKNKNSFQPVCDLQFRPIKTLEHYCKEKCHNEDFATAIEEENVQELGECCHSACSAIEEYKPVCNSRSFEYLDQPTYCEQLCSPEQQKFTGCGENNKEECSQRDCMIKKCENTIEPDFTSICLSEPLKGVEENNMSTRFFANQKEYCSQMVDLEYSDFNLDKSIYCVEGEGDVVDCANEDNCCLARCMHEEYKNGCTEDFNVIYQRDFCMLRCLINEEVDINLSHCESDEGRVDCIQANCAVKRCMAEAPPVEGTLCPNQFVDDFQFFEDKKDFCERFVHKYGLINTNYTRDLLSCDGEHCESKRDCCAAKCGLSSPVCGEDGIAYHNDCARQCEKPGFDLFYVCRSDSKLEDCQNKCSKLTCADQCGEPIETALFCSADGSLHDNDCLINCAGGARFRCEIDERTFSSGTFLIRNCKFRCLRAKEIDYPEAFQISRDTICFENPDCGPDSYCSYNQCETIIPVQEGCHINAECESGYCNLSTNSCQKKPDICLADIDCVDEEICSYGTCRVKDVTVCQPACLDGDECINGRCVGPCSPNPCTSLETCVAGICMCGDNGPCPSNEICDGTDCLCGTNPTCADGLTCNGTKCICTENGDCGDGEVCDIAGDCVPDPCDPNPCEGEETCNDGVCYCGAGPSCGNLTCSAALCICLANSDCGEGEKCEGNFCVPDLCFNVECPGDEFCNSEGNCSCGTGPPCPGSLTCVSTACVCIDNEDCGEGYLCNNIGACEEDQCYGVSCPGETCVEGTCMCGAGPSCTAPLTCLNQDKCACSTNEDCGPGSLCNEAFDCVPDPCFDNSCLENETCTDGDCFCGENPGCGAPFTCNGTECKCSNDIDCGDGFYCDANFDCALDFCFDSPCNVGETCDRELGSCFCGDPVADMRCNIGERCDSGFCFCGSLTRCTGSQICIDFQCRCTIDSDCPLPNQICDNPLGGDCETALGQ